MWSHGGVTMTRNVMYSQTKCHSATLNTHIILILNTVQYSDFDISIVTIQPSQGMTTASVPTGTFTGEGETPCQFSTVSITKSEHKLFTYLLLTSTLNKCMARTPALQCSSDIHDESFPIFSFFNHKKKKKLLTEQMQ